MQGRPAGRRPHRPRSGLRLPPRPPLLLAAAALASTSCDAGAPVRPLDSPYLHVLEIRAATDVAADGRIVYGTFAEGRVLDVLATTSIHLRFDRFLLPASVLRQSACLEPRLASPRQPEECLAGVALEPSYDPVRREVVFRQRPDNKPLLPSTTYRLTLYAPEVFTTRTAGLRAFDGAPLREMVRVDLRVRAPGDVDPPYDGPPAGEVFCGGEACAAHCRQVPPRPDVAACQGACDEGDDACAAKCVDACVAACPERGVWDALQGCASAGCHRAPDAAEGLDLGSLEGLTATALDRVAHQTQQGEHAGTYEESPALFGRSMPVLAPDSAGTSYLLYKLLVSHDAGLGDERASDAEIARLRRAIVVGSPMPPANAPPGAFPGPGEVEAVSRWLLQGAPLEDCAAP